MNLCAEVLWPFTGYLLLVVCVIRLQVQVGYRLCVRSSLEGIPVQAYHFILFCPSSREGENLFRVEWLLEFIHKFLVSVCFVVEICVVLRKDRSDSQIPYIK